MVVPQTVLNRVPSVVQHGSALPAKCTDSSQIYIRTGVGMYYCSAQDVWTLLTVGHALPSGTVVAITTGTCPSGTSQVTALNGKTLFGTLAANGNVGTTGGSDTITPAGTNGTPTFTGSALGATTFTLASTGATNAEASATSIVSNAGILATISGSSGGVAVLTDTTTAKSAGTPVGTVTAPAFTGTSFDNRSAFTYVIFCSAT